MKKYITWLVTEYKRAVYVLPSSLKRAVITVLGIFAVAVVIVFCALRIMANDDEEMSLIKVGYVADDNMLTSLAISYVEDMESVKSICSLVRIEDEKTGLEKLENGELSALVVLPDDVIKEIVYGTNAHGKLYLPKSSTQIDTGSGIGNVAVILFEELEKAGMGMLSTAQAEIYATEAVLGWDYDLESMYDDIDRFNLSQVTGREKLFSYKKISVTENDTYAVYYLSALLTVIMLISGNFFAKYAKRNMREQVFVKRRLGIGYTYQSLCRYMGGSLIGILVWIIFVATLYIPQIRAIVGISISFEGILALIVAIIFMTVFNMLVFEMAENRQVSVVIIGFNAILQAYMSGCIVPTVLLPDKIAKVGGVIPATFIKKTFRMIITSRKDDLPIVVRSLAIWGTLLVCLHLILIRIKEDASFGLGRQNRIKICKHFHVPSIWAIIFRRFAMKKSIWLCLVVITVASVMIVKTEKTSDTNVTVAFYDESGELGQILEEYDGLVKFVGYESENDLKQAVLKDEVECGYVIPQKLVNSMLSNAANGLITVYHDEDAVAVPIANEILFERLFKVVSLRWYREYIAKVDKSLADSALTSFEDKINEKVTFDIDIERIGLQVSEAGVQEDSMTTYPVWAVAVLVVAICGIYGIIQVMSDVRKKRFYRCKKFLIYSYTVLIPILFGIVTGVIIIAIIVNMGQYSY